MGAGVEVSQKLIFVALAEGGGASLAPLSTRCVPGSPCQPCGALQRGCCRPGVWQLRWVEDEPLLPAVWKGRRKVTAT